MTINAPMGDIVDRNGKILASNIVTTTIYVLLNQIKDKEKFSKNIAYILDCDNNDVYKYVSKPSSLEIIRKGTDLNNDVADKLEALNYDGVYLVVDYKRNYLYDEVLSHIIRFVDSDNQGLSGLELTYDNLDIVLVLAVNNELQNAKDKYETEHSLSIIMKSDTGKILTMRSKPSFAPSNY